MKMMEWKSERAVVFRLLEPRLDALTAPIMRDALLRAVDRGTQFIVIDLSDVLFMDSATLSAFVAAAQRIGPRGRVALAGARGEVRRLLALTHMHLVFSLHDTVAGALEAAETPHPTELARAAGAMR